MVNLLGTDNDNANTIHYCQYCLCVTASVWQWLWYGGGQDRRLTSPWDDISHFCFCWVRRQRVHDTAWLPAVNHWRQASM